MTRSPPLFSRIQMCDIEKKRLSYTQHYTILLDGSLGLCVLYRSPSFSFLFFSFPLLLIFGVKQKSFLDESRKQS